MRRPIYVVFMDTGFFALEEKLPIFGGGKTIIQYDILEYV